MLVVRKKKLSRNDNIKSCKEALSHLMDNYKLDIEVYPQLENFQKLFLNMLKTMETVKKSRNNANTGLGKDRPITDETRAFIYQHKGDDVDVASRSFLTSLISGYVKASSLQSTEEKLFFRCDAHLCNVFRSAYIPDRIKLAKYCELRCIRLRVPQLDSAPEDYISSCLLVDGTILLGEELQLQENDLISWRELQKILFLTFKDGPNQ